MNRYKSQGEAVISPTKLSRIPRWCPGKGFTMKNPKHDCPDIFTKKELNSICEIPSLRREELTRVWKAKAERKDVDDRCRETVTHAEFLKERLREVKQEIEMISKELNNPHCPQIQNPQLVSTEHDCNKILQDFAKNNIRLQRDLLTNIDLEDKLTEDLANAQRKLWEAGLAEQIFSLEIEDKVLPSLIHYDKRKAFKAHKRIMKEKHAKENAEKIRLNTLNFVVDSIKTTANIPYRETQIAKKVYTARNARKKVEFYLKKTMHQRHQQRVNEACDHQMKQDYQHRNLTKLKKEIDNQKDTLLANHVAREKRMERIAKEKEEIRATFALSGKNPFYVEHLLAIEEKRTILQRKILEKEQDRLAQLHRDFEVTEKSKRHEELNRKKWESFWAKKLNERKKVLRAKQTEFFHIFVPENHEPLGYEASENETEANSADKPELESKNSLQEIKKSLDKSRPKSLSKNLEDQGSVVSSQKSDRSSINGKIPVIKAKLSQDVTRHSVFQRLQSIAVGPSSQEKGGEDYEDIDEEMDSVLKSDEVMGEFDEYQYDLIKGRMKGNNDKLRDSKGIAIQRVEFKTTPDSSGDSQFRFHPHSKSKALFKKPTFKWNPDVLLFCDYEVGKTYRKILTISNISNERVKFFLKEFSDVSKRKKSSSKVNEDIPKLTEIITLKSGASKSLSPGLTHNIVVTFTPSVVENWSGLLEFQSSREPFKIPIQCQKKRFNPILSNYKVTFTNVVVNTAALLTLTLKNGGSKNGFIARLYQPSLEAERLELESARTDNTTLESEQSKSFKSIIRQKSEHGNEIAFPKSARATEIGLSRKESQMPRITLNRKESQKSDMDLYRKESGMPDNEFKSHKYNTRKHKGQNEGTINIVRGILDEIVKSLLEDVFVSYVKECNRNLAKDETRTICVVFRPCYVGHFRTHFEIIFGDSEDQSIMFTVQGTSMENPIILEPLNTDFRIMMMDHNYQQVITVHTTIKGAGKVTPQIPSELQPFVKIVPSVTTVFTGNPGKFYLKISPKKRMLEETDPAFKFLDEQTNIIDFPVLFHLKFPYKVTSPLITTFMGVITNQELVFYPNEIDMGRCSTIETVQSTFSIYNNSILPQHIAFVEVPDCITIQSNMGFATLLPKEKRNFDLLLSLRESAVGEVNWVLKCQTLEQREYFIKVVAQARINHIHFSQSRILFPVTACGSISTAIIEIFSNAADLRNHSAPTAIPKFNFSIKPEMPLTILPQAGFINPGQSTKILVRFHPQLSIENIKIHMLEMMEKQYIQNHAMFKRELDGIKLALKYSIVIPEESDIIEDVVINISDKGLTDLPRSSESVETKRKSEAKLEKPELRSSFVQAASVQSDFKLLGSEIPDASTSVGSQGSNKSDRKKSTSSTKSDSQHSYNSLQSKARERKAQVKRVSKELVEIARRVSLTPQEKATKKLEARRDELIKLLGFKYVPPNMNAIDTESQEFSKAKRSLMKHLETSSSSFKIPCFVTDSFNDTEMLILYVKCPVSHPSIVMLEESPMVNFGSVAIGSDVHKEVRLYNISEGTVKLKMDIINPYGPFLQCNALRKIPPNHVFTLRLRYQPNDTRIRKETINIRGGDSRLSITLVGEGVVPEFTLKPLKSEFDIGEVIVDNFGYQDFQITNSSRAKLKFNIELLDHGIYDQYRKSRVSLNLSSTTRDSTNVYPEEASTADQEEASFWILEDPEEEMSDEMVPPSSPTEDESTKKSSIKSRNSFEIESTQNESLHTISNISEDPRESITSSSRKSKTASSRKSKPGSFSKSKDDSLRKSNEDSPRKSKESDPLKLSIQKNKSKKTTVMKHKGSIELKLPDLPEPIFEMEGEEIGTHLHLGKKEVVTYLEKKGEKYFFQAIPSTLIIQAGDTERFRTYFLPADSGVFYAKFGVRLQNKIIHQFTLFGTGNNLRSNSGEEEEEEPNESNNK